MLNFRIRISSIKFDGTTYLRDLDRALSKLVREAARAWLIAVLEHDVNAPHAVGDNFPIATGEAKGAFRPLGRRLGVNIPITPAVDSRYKDGRLRPDHSADGEAQSFFEVPGSARGVGRIPPKYVFDFESEVAHHLVNEYTSEYAGRVRSAVPWRAFAAGDAAFKETYDIGFQLLPRVNSYIIESTEDGIDI